jgi:hypothetical protein
MTYYHGVYVSERETSIRPQANAASCLPYVIGVVNFGSDATAELNVPVLCHTYKDFLAAFDVEDSPVIEFDDYTLSAFARHWYKRAGGGDCIFVAIEKSDTRRFKVHGDEKVESINGTEYPLHDYYSDEKISYSASLIDTIESVTVPDSSLSWEAAGFPTTSQTKTAVGIKTSTTGSSATLTGVVTITANLSDSFINPHPAFDALDEVYSRLAKIPTVICFPRYAIDLDNNVNYCSELAQKARSFGDGWSAIALVDLAYNWGNSQPQKPLNSPYLLYCSPRCLCNNEYVDASTVVCGTLANVDNINGGFPFVSPSNQLAYIDGIIDESGQQIYNNRFICNENFNAWGVVTFWNNPKGWCVWGNNTSAYPSNTDPKDRFIPIRRTFGYIENDFIVYAAPRIDLPINKRQIEGIINGYNQRLKGFIGVGVVNSARVSYSANNTPESLLNGTLYIDVFIAPPPPTENLQATFEYDVEGFVASLA